MPPIKLTVLQNWFDGSSFPGAPEQIERLEAINIGWESEVYGFRALYGPHNPRKADELILRLYPGEDALEKSTREFEALKLLHAAGYPVPRVDWLEQARSPFGKPFMIMERVAGASMSQSIFSAPPAEQARLLDVFCALFARLHALQVDPGQPPEAAAPHPAIALSTTAAETLAGWQDVIDRLPVPGFAANFQWLLDQLPHIQPLPPVPLHWDFHPDNILLRPDGQAVVIDWTSFELADYRFDLAWTLLLMGSQHGPP